jgi:hypothetical protein
VKIGLVLAAAGVINGYCFYLYAFQLEWCSKNSPVTTLKRILILYLVDTFPGQCFALIHVFDGRCSFLISKMRKTSLY